MFHRRLLLQWVVLCAVIGVLVVRLGQITLAENAERLEAAERRLVRRDWSPTTRGRILDREGRVLAMDRPSYGVAIDYRVLSGEWARDQGRRLARRVYADRWLDADEATRDALAAPLVDQYQGIVSRSFDRIAEQTRTDPSVVVARIDAVLRRVERMRASVAEARRDRLVEQHLESGRGLTEADEIRLTKAADTTIEEERRAHVIVADLPDDAAFALRRMLLRRVPVSVPERAGSSVDEPVYTDLLPGVSIKDATDRVRPFDVVEVAIDRATLPGPMKGEGMETVRVSGVGRHVLGTLRTRLYREDHESRAAAATDPAIDSAAWFTESGVDRGRYEAGDSVGASGVERAHEHELRGLRGLRTVRLDTGEAWAADPVAGRDVRLTIDAMMQARIRAVLEPSVGLTTVQPWHGNGGVPEGETLAGAAVVIDIDTGQVLALVSTPSPEGDTRWEEAPEASAYPSFLDPHINRAIAVPYPPGSIVKPLMLSEAVARGYHRLGAGVVCTGHLLDNRTDVYRCWIYKRYGLTHSPTGEPVRAAESVKYSCNIFYYELGRRMGPVEIVDIFADLGVGSGFGLGVGSEWPGKVGPVNGPGDGSDLGISDAILMAMGQGPVTWTPLHAANAYATLARGGAIIPPTIVDDGRGTRVTGQARFSPAAVEAALEGLSGSVNDPRGTGSTIGFEGGREKIFNAPGVRVWGKTGTAQAPPLMGDPDGEGGAEASVVRSGDHAWFAVLVGPEGGGPRYAVSVLIEYGGGSGRVAGPVANQIVHALIAEGYLPGGGRSGRGGSLAGGTP
jgi:penicillin-binding protein 2